MQTSETLLHAITTLSCATAVKGSEYAGDAGAAYPGDIVTYTYDIYNSGTTTLSGLSLVHSKVGVLDKLLVTLAGREMKHAANGVVGKLGLRLKSVCEP